MMKKCVALLGRRDAPTDAVEEYCENLRDALDEHNFAMELVRVAWVEKGWSTALQEIERRAKEWRGCWVLAQYTALAWSERGFPLWFLRVLRVVRRNGGRLAMVYHDPLPFVGNRAIDKLRRRAQVHVMSEALRTSELGVFTIPVNKIAWIEKRTTPLAFIPVGANLREPERAWASRRDQQKHLPTIVVYGITGGPDGMWDLAKISEVLQVVAERLGRVRLVALGRNSEVAATALKSLSEREQADICALGVLPAEEVVRWMSESDVMLFVRGGISSRRGSAIAGIACGLPVVAFEGPETAPPITEAGVVLADQHRQRAMGEEVLKVLSDQKYREALMERSRRAQAEHFSWKAIAALYAKALRPLNDKEQLVLS